VKRLCSVSCQVDEYEEEVEGGFQNDFEAKILARLAGMLVEVNSVVGLQ